MSDHFINLPQAIEMTTRYRAKKEEILNPEYRGKNTLLLAETFDRAAFDKLLSEEGCTSIRIYFGMNVDMQVRAIFVGVNDRNEDLLPKESTLTATASTDDGNTIVEEGAPCPTICPTSSSLNG
jgi:hypothetical protein